MAVHLHVIRWNPLPIWSVLTKWYDNEFCKIQEMFTEECIPLTIVTLLIQGSKVVKY